jgi:hypothetical protein
VVCEIDISNLSFSDNFLTRVVLPAPEGEDNIIITPSFSDGI